MPRGLPAGLEQRGSAGGGLCCSTARLPSQGPFEEGGGVGTRPWWLALLACGGAYWPLALEQGERGGWHKALGVGSVSLWRRLLASCP